MKTLYLMDGHSQIYRCYHARLQELTSPSGEPTKATFLFTKLLFSMLVNKRPDYFVVALDSRRDDSWRRKLYPQYKANRGEVDEDIIVQVNRIREVLQTMGVYIVRKRGYEADDIVGTLVERWRSVPGLQITIITRDKDLEQLIGPTVTTYDPMDEEEMDAQAVFDKRGVRPDQFRDYLALVGDSSDNLPGVRGIGPKAALGLLGEYGSIGRVVEYLWQLPATQRAKMKEAVDSGHLDLMLRLVSLDAKVPVDCVLEDLRTPRIDVTKLAPLFRHLGFSSLLARLKGRAVRERL